MNNKLIKIQEMLLHQMENLNNTNDLNSEIGRSNALTNGALTYLKSVNTQLRIKEVSEKSGQTLSSLEKELGINEK